MKYIRLKNLKQLFSQAGRLWLAVRCKVADEPPKVLGHHGLISDQERRQPAL